jgi:fibronectin-binding autotransporter adhesin
VRNLSGANAFNGTLTLGGNTLIQSDAGTLTLGGANAIVAGSSVLTVGGAGDVVVRAPSPARPPASPRSAPVA